MRETNERIERFTALARRAWPAKEIEVVAHDPTYAFVDHSGEGFLVDIGPHPLALDALQAALCVLAGEPTPMEARLLALAEEATSGAREARETADEANAVARQAIDLLEAAKRGAP